MIIWRFAVADPTGRFRLDTRKTILKGDTTFAKMSLTCRQISNEAYGLVLRQNKITVTFFQKFRQASKGDRKLVLGDYEDPDGHILQGAEIPQDWSHVFKHRSRSSEDRLNDWMCYWSGPPDVLIKQLDLYDCMYCRIRRYPSESGMLYSQSPSFYNSSRFFQRLKDWKMALNIQQIRYNIQISNALKVEEKLITFLKETKEITDTIKVRIRGFSAWEDLLKPQECSDEVQGQNDPGANDDDERVATLRKFLLKMKVVAIESGIEIVE